MIIKRRSGNRIGGTVPPTLYDCLMISVICAKTTEAERQVINLREKKSECCCNKVQIHLKCCNHIVAET